MTLNRPRTETGTAAIELVVGVALVLVPMAMIVLSFAPLLEARTFVRLASSELARTVAVTDGDELLAFSTVRNTAANNNIDPDAVRVSLCGGAESNLSDSPASTCLNSFGTLERGTYVTVFMSVSVDVVPFFTRSLSLSTGYEHAELVDQYRSITQP